MDGTQNLMIDDVIHQAYVDVNEEGTETAGPTYVKIVYKGDRQDPDPPGYPGGSSFHIYYSG